MAQNAKIEKLIQPVLEAHAAFLVDFTVRGDRNMKVVEIFVDTEAGINAETCALISREISPLFEQSDEFSDRFTIVVSSPGLDRPLKFLQQYRRNLGKMVRVSLQSPDGPRKLQGELIDVQPDFIRIRPEKGEPEQIPIDTIIETLVIPRW
jgi:ribosome maturation factor RimP